MSPAILPQVANLRTSMKVLAALLTLYLSTSTMRLLFLHRQFLAISKGMKTMYEYLSHVQSLRNQLVAIEEVILELEVILNVIVGLDPGYESPVTSLTMEFDQTMTFTNLSKLFCVIMKWATICRSRQRYQSMFWPNPLSSMLVRSHAKFVGEKGTGLWSVVSPKEYTCFTTVTTANGDQMRISHIGHSKYSDGIHDFDMNNIFVIPNASKNLMLVYQFCLDNNVYMEFDH